MGRRLKDGLSSAYFEAANRLNRKKARRRIVAYVESYDDVFFWRNILGRFEDDTRYFEVMLPSHKKLERGKRSALTNIIGNNFGRDMIACVDADYDYLLQGQTPMSDMVNNNPFVFHTYVYAIENYWCYAPGLHEACVMATLNDHNIFDFEEYIRQFSKIVFPLFVWSIWFYKKNIKSKFTITDFCKTIEMGRFNIRHAYDSLDRLRSKVSTKIDALQREYPDAKDSYLDVKKEIMQLGVTPETTYLFIQGHHIFDNLVMPMMLKVCDILENERQRDIRLKSVHGTQMDNELTCYANSTEDVSSMLRKNNVYTQSVPFQQVLEDVRNYIENGNNVYKEE